MKTYVCATQTDVLSVCRELAESGITVVQELDLRQLDALSPQDLSRSIVILDRPTAEQISPGSLRQLPCRATRVMVHCEDIPTASFLDFCSGLGLELVIGPAAAVLPRRLEDSLRLEGLQQSREGSGPDKTTDPTCKIPADPDFLQRRLRILDGQRERLSSVLETLSMLSRLSQEISTLDLDEIVSVCVTKVPLLVNARFASFYMHDFQAGLLRLRRHNHGYHIDDLVTVNRESSSAMVRALLDRKILLVRDFDEHERLNAVRVERPHAGHYSSRSCLIVPMVAGDRVVAVLNLADKRDGTFFDQDDLAPLEQLSVLVGATIRNFQLFQEVRTRARTDCMTGFVNHQAFFEELEREMLRVRRYPEPLSLLMTDVDNFKLVNDVYGHQVGDFILKETARVIRLNMRETDIPARYGGDEFAVILEHTDVDHALQVAERIRQTIDRQSFTCDGNVLSLSLSIGVAQYRPGMSVREFVNEVDKALYASKQQGRNRVSHPAAES